MKRSQHLRFGKWTRGSDGSMLAMIAVFDLSLSLIGIGLFLIIMLLGGSSELQNSVDSGTLAVAKELPLNPAVDLLPNEVPGLDERAEFVECTDPKTSQVNLATINQVMLHALVVATNAQKNGSPQGIQQAHLVVEASQLISNRLKNAVLGFNTIAKGITASQVFAKTAQSNSLRMLDDGQAQTLSVTGYQCSYLNQDGSGVSNARVDGLDFPGKDKLTKVLSDGHAYMIGYTDVPVLDTCIQFVPVQPLQQPHLVSRRDFAENQKPPRTAAQFKSGGPIAVNPVPPNSIGMSAQAQVNNTRYKVQSCAAGILAINARRSRPYFLRVHVNWYNRRRISYLGLPTTLSGNFQSIASDPTADAAMKTALLPAFRLLNPTADATFVQKFFSTNDTPLAAYGVWNSSDPLAPFNTPTDSLPPPKQPNPNWYYIFDDPSTGKVTFNNVLPPGLNPSATPDGIDQFIVDPKENPNGPEAPYHVHMYLGFTPGSGLNGNLGDLYFDGVRSL